jgi:hypothetical protein
VLDAWLYFPGIKVGNIYLYSSFLTIFGGVDYESFDSTIILSRARLTGTVFSCRFCLLSKTSLNKSFINRRTLCVGEQSEFKNIELMYFKQSATRNFMTKGDQPPNRHLVIILI